MPVKPAPAGRATLLLLIVIGGSIGTACRYGIETAFADSTDEVPWATLAINLSGAFLLGVLVQAVTATGPDQGWRQKARLGLGTGLLGGYTTYSTFALESVILGMRGHLVTAAVYDALSLLLGFIAAYAGLAITRKLTGRARQSRGGAFG